MRYLLPVIVAVLFIIEGTWFQVLFPPSFDRDLIWVPRFALVVIILISIYRGPLTGLVYGVIIGFFQDVVYSSIIGIYMFSYGLLAYMGGISLPYVKNRLLLVFAIVLAVLSGLEILTYLMYQWIGYTNMRFEEFARLRWLPSLLMNGAFCILIFYPMRKFFVWLDQEERLKNS